MIEYVKIIKNTEISRGIYEAEFELGSSGVQIKPGQFINLYPNDKSLTLPRPIAVCDLNGNRLSIVYGVVGKGTKHFSALREGERIKIMYPLGNGYSLGEEKNHVLVAGGPGIAPLLYLSKSLKGNVTLFAGFESQAYLTDRFNNVTPYIATETGAEGERGTVCDILEKYDKGGDMYYVCGTAPMLKAVCRYLEKNGANAQISVESRMACGYGLCVCCAIKVKQGDSFNYLKACVDGPVFDYKEVLWD